MIAASPMKRLGPWMKLPRWSCGCARMRARLARAQCSTSPVGGGPTDLAVSFNDLIRAGEKRGRNRQAERIRRSLVYGKRKAVRLFNRKVSGFGSLQYLIDESS